MSSDDSNTEKSFEKNVNQNIQPIISKLSNDFSYQKSYITLLNQTIKKSISGNEKEISTLEKINNMLPSLIKELGLPFCDLINSDPDILDYYCDLYQKDERAKNILISFIDIYNFKSIEVNPSDDLIEKLEKYDPDTFKKIENSKRLNKTEIENLYDELSELFSIWRICINMEDNIENDLFQQFHNSLKEKYDKINEIEKEKKYSKATIEFFRDKIKNYEISIKNMDLNKKITQTFKKKLDNNLFSPKNNSEMSNYHSNPINHNKKDKININNNNLNNINITQFNISNDENSDFNIEEILKKLKEIPLKDRTSFYKDEILVKGEDEFTEFKNYSFPLNEKQGEEIKRQICGFLNGQGGRLYLGINDQKIVKGVELNYKKSDALRNLLVNYTYDFYPKCRIDKIKVSFIPIKNMKDNTFINNLYVVKIIISQGEPYLLYSMTNKGFNSAIRLQGQCANLSAEEIYNEIIRRGILKNNFSNNNVINNDFNDPEPEINYNIEKDIDENDWIINNKKSNKNNENKYSHRNKKKKMNRRDLFIVEVNNIDVNLDTKKIYEFFNGCGSIYQKFFSKEDGKSRGYGILKFSNENLAKSTIDKFNQSKLGSNNIILKMKKNKD